MQNLLKTRPRKNALMYYLMMFWIGAALYMIYKKVMLKRYVIIHWDPVTPDISCHYSMEEDALPAADAAGFAPAPRSIFFHETSCRGGLDSRQACAVEAAARSHPRRQVHLLFSAPVTQHVLENSCIAKLLELKNVNVARVHIVEYSKDTEIHSFITNYLGDSKWNRTDYPVEYTADVLRFITLNKWGGISMDLDMLVTRSLKSLPLNWIVRLSQTKIATGIVAFAKDDFGTDVTASILKKMASTDDPFNLFMNGRQAVFEAISEKCPGVLHVPGVGGCDGLGIYSHEEFYPLDPKYWYVYYNTALEVDVALSNNVYTHHMWNRQGKEYSIDPNSPYAQLAKRYCPDIYEMYGDEFGV